MKKTLFVFLFAFAITGLNIAKAENNPIFKFGAYVDTYYSSDNDKAGENSLRSLTAANSLKDRFGLNIAQLYLSTESDNYRANLTMHYGDLPDVAWLDNPKMIQQAYAGIKLFNNFWVDGGYFLTHIGSESLTPKDNWLSTHSIVTYNEPFYQAGLKFTYQPTSNITTQIQLLNGLNQFKDVNENKSLGVFLAYTADENLFSISYAGQYGNEAPSKFKANTTMFHNLCFAVNPIKNLEIKGHLDYIMREDYLLQEDNDELTEANLLGVSLQLRYTFIDNLRATLRYAMVNDEDNKSTNLQNLSDITLGVEYLPTPNSYIRLEGRNITSSDLNVFVVDGKPEKSRNEVSFNFGVFFDYTTK